MWCWYDPWNNFHRTDGPACIMKNNNVFTYGYYLGGKRYTKDKWFAVLTPEKKTEAIWNLI